MTIYIGNLSFQAEQEHLFDLFSEYGEVKTAACPWIEKPAASAVSPLWKW